MTRKEQVRECSRRWYFANKKRAKFLCRRWNKRNKERLRELQRNWKRKNRKKCSEATRRWLDKNTIKNRETHRRYLRQRWKTDLSFRLLVTLRNRMRQALKKNYKSSGTERLTGCSMRELKQYLESLFRPGMTWENYGPVWHIDHQTPCVRFNLSLPEQQRKCFHFTNLQPLFASENLRKNKYVSC